jgi:phosphoribosylformylglycinamidine cyclo-ligase
VIIGLASNGIHSNGFSLARNVLFDQLKLRADDMMDELGTSIGMELLRPTRIYVKSLLNIIKNFAVKGIIHITGGGFWDNIPRILPTPCQAVITKGTWEIPQIFKIIQEAGNIDEMEMFRVFNMGIGMMIVVSKKESKEIMERLEVLGEKVSMIGSIAKRSKDQPAVLLE